MKDMKTEWEEIEFIMTSYRDTGVSILSSIDDIQIKLDDHVLQTQTIRGTTFPFSPDMYSSKIYFIYQYYYSM